MSKTDKMIETHKINNLPISYDYHGEIPLDVPFDTISKNDMYIYLDVNTHVGADACGQSCLHCWFVNYAKVHKRSFDPDEGVEIFKALSSEGYRVFPHYTDSFAYGAEQIRIYDTVQIRSYFAGSDVAQPTKTMEKGEAWTSGKPLLGKNCDKFLDIARKADYGTITMTFHGLIDEKGAVLDQEKYPIKGSFPAKNFESVVGNIRRYNGEHNEADGFDGFRIGVGITVGTHNNSPEMLQRYVAYFNAMGVAAVRFNKFLDHGGHYPHLVLSDEQSAQFYKDIKQIHTSTPINFQMGVSEDFGSFGIEVMEFPKYVGTCQAGRLLFTITPSQEVHVVACDGNAIYERIGDVTACVNIFEPKVGDLLRIRNKAEGSDHKYELRFDQTAIDLLAEKRLNGTFVNGCFARELLDEISRSGDAPQSALTKNSRRKFGPKTTCG